MRSTLQRGNFNVKSTAALLSVGFFLMCSFINVPFPLSITEGQYTGGSGNGSGQGPIFFCDVSDLCADQRSQVRSFRLLLRSYHSGFVGTISTLFGYVNIKLILFSLKKKKCNRVYCIHVSAHDPLIFSFRFPFLFDWVGVLWAQLSKVLKPVRWAGSVPFPPVSLQRQVVCCCGRCSCVHLRGEPTLFPGWCK